MTLKDIAHEAGVSISTVSRVINNTGSNAASQEVRERIWDIVRRTGYIPNHSAQNLKLGKSEAAISSHSLTCLFARTPSAPNNPFFATIAKSVESEAYRQNYFLKSSFTSFDINNVESYQVLQGSTNGVVILGRCDKTTLKFLKQYCHHVIYTGLNPLDAKYDQVLCDGYEAALTALEYLFQLGHRHIGYVGEIESENRYRGYCDFLQKHDLPFDSSYVAAVPLTSSDGYDGTLQLLEQQPRLTAIFCGDDITAIGVLRAIKDFGLKVPADLSVISIDDIDTAQFLSPMLTTIHVPMEEMGSLAAKILIDRINGGHTLPLQIKLPFYLAKRESCAKPRTFSK
ncbi:MAG: LacI family DNA-binding transcriptional regulator [Clostridiales bacterium]|nr:LacI family DNA-binding transcriptional regulator [Clostridiales bacterium]